MAKKAIRPIRIEGNIAYVPLTQGYEAVIDADDVPLVSGFNWWAKVRKDRKGVVASVYAVRTEARDLGCRKVYLHREIIGAADGIGVDHVSGDGLDNRRVNIRCATKSENGRNRGTQCNNTSGRKGVTFFKLTGKWRAEITANGKTHSLGYFDAKDSAAAAYEDAATGLHGEFRRLR